MPTLGTDSIASQYQSRVGDRPGVQYVIESVSNLNELALRSCLRVASVVDKAPVLILIDGVPDH
jgi:hypothetical protein